MSRAEQDQRLFFFFGRVGADFTKNKKLHGNDGTPTSKIAKLVKWLQLQSVSLAVLFIIKQPSEFQPPDLSVGRNSTRTLFSSFFLFLISKDMHFQKKYLTVHCEVPENTGSHKICLWFGVEKEIVLICNRQRHAERRLLLCCHFILLTNSQERAPCFSGQFQHFPADQRWRGWPHSLPESHC